MSNKYIIKNCPCYDCGFCTGSNINTRICRNYTDCVMKQIVSRLNNFAEDYGLDAGFYADELLSYLNIQEVE